jgi:hypothetical protein
LDDTDGGGDIAFVKHTTVRDFKNPETNSTVTNTTKVSWQSLLPVLHSVVSNWMALLRLHRGMAVDQLQGNKKMDARVI